MNFHWNSYLFIYFFVYFIVYFRLYNLIGGHVNKTYSHTWLKKREEEKDIYKPCIMLCTRFNLRWSYKPRKMLPFTWKFYTFNLVLTSWLMRVLDSNSAGLKHSPKALLKGKKWNIYKLVSAVFPELRWSIDGLFSSPTMFYELGLH